MAASAISRVDGKATRSSGPAENTIRSLWANRRLSYGVSVAWAAFGGLAAAGVMPRGPATGEEAILWMVGTSVVGLIGGVVLGSRWSLLLSPTIFVLVFEVARSGTAGPTVDGIHLDSTYGIIAIVVGRGATYLLGLMPLLLGSIYGVELASRLGRSGGRTMGLLGWAVTGGFSIVLVLLAMAILRPGTTAPIVGVDGQPVTGSIAELTMVPLGGQAQALMIRGRDVDDPVLLHLAGGPGGTDLGAMRADTALEEDFIVVTWEQRGVGKSYRSLEPVQTLTLGSMVDNTIELTEYLRERFDEERIYLTGNSWGSTLGVLAAQQRPDLYYAFVGTGQMVSQRETDKMFYEDTLAWARAVGDLALVATLERNGPPPYADVNAYEPALSHEHDWNVYAEWDGDRELPATLFVPENDLMARVNGLRGFLDTFSVLYPRLQDIDFRVDVPTLEVPFTMIVGAHEARGRAVLADEWFKMLQAPSKQRIVFEHSGHRPSFEEPARFATVMAEIRDATQP